MKLGTDKVQAINSLSKIVAPEEGEPICDYGKLIDERLPSVRESAYTYGGFESYALRHTVCGLEVFSNGQFASQEWMA